MKRYIFIFSCLFICLVNNAQSKWTLRDCINYAIENNIEIKQQELNVENSKIDLNTTKNSRLPNLNASVSHQFNWGRYGQNAQDSVQGKYKYKSGSNNFSNTRLGIESSAPLFTGFRIPNQIAADKLNLQASIEGLKKAKENMELQVTSYYLEVLFKKEILRVYEEQVNLSKLQVDKTQILVDVGKVPLSQLYDIRAQLAKDELNATNAFNDLKISLLNLAQLLSLNEIDDFDISEPYLGDVIADNQSSIQPVNQIYSTAISIKPHVKEAEYNIEGSKKLVKVAQAGYYPKLDLNLGYGTNSQRIYGVDNISFNKQLKDNGSFYMGFSLSIPIFNRFQVRNQVRSARLKVTNNQLVLDNVKLNLYKEIQQAYQNAIIAQAKYTSTEKAYEAASEAFRYAKDRYAVGKSTVFEFSESQTRLLSSKSEQIQAKYDFLFRAKILDFYSGKEIDIK